MIFCSDCDINGQLQFFNGNKWMGFTTVTATDHIVNLPSCISNCSQVWTQKNLDVDHYRNGDPIPQITDATQWINTSSGAWCWYNNDSGTYASTYGRLYNWFAVTDPRGLAPIGWHVATDSESNILSICNGGISVAGASLKETGNNHWTSSSNVGTNLFGFTALPGGFRNSSGAFSSIGTQGDWWTTSIYDATYARQFFISNNSATYFKGNGPKIQGMSVRLVKD